VRVKQFDFPLGDSKVDLESPKQDQTATDNQSARSGKLNSGQMSQQIAMRKQFEAVHNYEKQACRE
jgi:hypothetical protein